MPEIGAGVEAEVVARLRAAELLIATAESTTGGLVGHRLAAVPGASSVLAGGITAYADEAKTRLLRIPEAVLARHGSVSSEVATAMARGAREAFGVSVTVAETGIAGPSDSKTKPVGLYYLAAISPGCELTERASFGGERAETQWAASEAALRLVLICLDGATAESRISISRTEGDQNG